MKWTIGRRITAGFLVGLALVVLMAGVGVWALQTSAGGYRFALELERDVHDGALAARADARGANTHFLRYMLEAREEDARGVDSLVAETRARLRQLQAVDPDPETQAAWTEALGLVDQWDAVVRSAVAARRAGDFDEASRVREETARPARLALDAALARGLERAETRTDRQLERAAELERRSATGLWLAAAFALLLGALAAWYLNRIITGPLRETSSVVAASATEILATATQQASGATQSLSAVTQTAATADQVVQTAEQSAERAHMVAQSAQRAAEIGRQGREAVEGSIAAMDALEERVESIGESILALAEQAQAIGEIISTVNDLAEQTNLLALNASIEAARAGESGRGFAVVAGEIRSLAEESKSATARVRQILGEIQRATSGAVMAMEEGTKQAQVGSRQVVEAGATIRSLVDAVNQAAQAAAQISASAGQQSTGMSQIREAITSIQEAAQQNLAATKQAESAAQDLNRLGSELLELVGRDARDGGELVRREAAATR